MPTNSEQPVDALIGQVLADRYRIIRTLGEGGMGRVYLAEHVRMGRLSAVKVMTPELAPTPDAISRFNREAANASRINHPNVASIYDFGETTDGVLYLAMEYIEGETLSALSRRVGALPLAQVGDLVRQIADGLQAAHQLGIVHRDLKPDNILVSKDAEGRDRVKVVDFGIAKTVQGGGQTVTTVGMSIGTPAFMSPEQLAGDVVDARTDIYSLGLVAFTLLTGAHAYSNLTSKQSLVQRLTTRPRPLSEAHPTVAWPARLQVALDKALSPESADRYAKVSDFATEVSAATATIADISEVRTRAMTPLGIKAPLEAVRSPGGARRAALIAAGVLVAVSAGAMAIKWGAPAAPTAVAALEPPLPPPLTPTLQSSSVVVRDSQAAPLVATPAIAKAPVSVKRENTVATKTADSSAATPDSAIGSAAVSAGSEPTARDVQEHIARARRLFRNRMPAKAWPELRSAAEKFAVLSAAHPGAPETVMLRTQLTTTVSEALAECQQLRDGSPVPRKGMCEALEKVSAAIVPPSRDAAPPFRGPRRRAPGGQGARVPS